MPSYLVTGANRGLGLGFMHKLADDRDNIVIGMARDKAAAESSHAASFAANKNVHWVQGDLADIASLKHTHFFLTTRRHDIKHAVEAVSEITQGKLDFLIANGGLVSSHSAIDTLTELGNQDAGELEEDLVKCFQVNVIGNIFLFVEVLPLIRAGTWKKVVAISSGMADEDLILDYDIAVAAPYAISKSALNTALAKFQAEYRDDDILFMAISPGLVDTDGGRSSAGPSPEVAEKERKLGEKFLRASPNFGKKLTPAESATLVLAVVASATIKKNGGRMVSQLGNRQWM